MKKRVLIQSALGAGIKSVFDRRDDIAYEQVADQNPETFNQALPNYDAVILGLAPLTAELIAACPNLKIASRVGVGYDTIDVPAATKAGIPVTIGATSNSVTVAEHALFFMLALAKRALVYDRETRQGNWSIRLDLPAADLAGKTVLILGFGRIGRRLVKRCVAMDMRVLVHDPYVLQDAIRTAEAEPVADWRAQLGEIDYLSVNCMKNEETDGMVAASELAAMRDDAFVLNTARGGIVDEAALLDALQSNAIAGAAIDPFIVEPALPDNPLFALDNIIVSPHSAGVTKESMFRMTQAAAQNVVDCFDGKLDLENVINPEVLDG